MPKSEEVLLRPIEKKDAFSVYLWELDQETQHVTQSEIKVSLQNIYALIEQQNETHNVEISYHNKIGRPLNLSETTKMTLY